MDLHETSLLFEGRARLAHRIILHTETPAEGRVSASASGAPVW
jgi:hypothetical protein